MLMLLVLLLELLLLLLLVVVGGGGGVGGLGAAAGSRQVGRLRVRRDTAALWRTAALNAACGGRTRRDGATSSRLLSSTCETKSTAK